MELYSFLVVVTRAALRIVRSEHFEGLLTVSTIVTRMTEVNQRVETAVYVCNTCRYEIYIEIECKLQVLAQSRPLHNYEER